ncbi:hypothetical protein V2J09_018387 [Rumex salicifolius]
MDSKTPTPHHVLIVSYPAQGQINPVLRLAKRLTSTGGFLVTFSTVAAAGQKIIEANDITVDHLYPVGDGFLRFDFFDSCASFLTFYYHYNQLVPFPTEEDPYSDVEIPTLPLLKWDELHSFLHPAYPFPCVTKTWLHEFRNLNKSFCIIIDTFDELENDIIDFTTKLCPAIKPVGPLFRDPIAPNSTKLLGADPHKADSDCLDWLDSKPPRSVVYVCFGSIAHIKQEQVDEMAHGILNTGAPFLWVMRPTEPGSFLKAHALPEEVGPDDGMVVEYSPQERVLAHPSLACFVTHCGWNSTVEALASGVPMVAFPQWGDQLTDAKFLVDVLGVAVRMGRGEHEDKVVSREEVERCIREATVGPKAGEMRRKAMTWKDKAYQIGGSSNKNLHGFVEEERWTTTYMIEYCWLLLAYLVSRCFP